MRALATSITTLPLVAALALTACADEGEEAMTDEALSAEDVASIEDNGDSVAPGEYSTSLELVELDAPGMSESAIADMRSAFAEGAAQPHLYCVTEQTDRAAWLSQMAEADCTVSRLTADGAELQGAMSCSAEEGLNGRVEFAGTTGEDSADLAMTYELPTQAGEATVRFRVQSNRVGDCG